MKNTKQKKAILDIINNSNNHLDAYQIYDEAKKQISNISLGTVYRNLGGLENDNLIISLMVNGIKHYDKVIPHYHFICKKCSKIVDVFDVKFPKIEKIENNINKFNKENSEKNKYFNSQIKSEFNNKIEENEIDYLLNENKKELDNIQENIEKEISSLKFKQHTNEFDYNNIIKKLEEKARIEEELQNSLEEKDELLKLEKEITIAKIAIERAYEKMKNEITPKFTKNLSNIVDKISNGKYNKIKFVDGEGLIVELENGEYVNANKLSIGTIDELYLSLRLSAIEEITREKMPIILDEAFAYFDNQRLENILEFINNNLTENQVIIFTCSNREKDILNKKNIKYNYIEI